MRFHVLVVVGMKIAVFWVVSSCRLVEVYRDFRGPYCLHHKVMGKLLINSDKLLTRLHGETTQKTANFMEMDMWVINNWRIS
jgi:hypothetical protein